MVFSLYYRDLCAASARSAASSDSAHPLRRKACRKGWGTHSSCHCRQAWLPLYSARVKLRQKGGPPALVVPRYAANSVARQYRYPVHPSMRLKMTLRSHILLLILLTTQLQLEGCVTHVPAGVPEQMTDNQTSELTCMIKTDALEWHTSKAAAQVDVDIHLEGTSPASIMPSLRLLSLSKEQGLNQDEYWAPFDVMTGTKTKKRQELAAGHHTVRVHPNQLLWASTKSSVWPSDKLGKTVKPGRYVVQVQLELSDGRKVSSNGVTVTLLK